VDEVLTERGGGQSVYMQVSKLYYYSAEWSSDNRKIHVLLLALTRVPAKPLFTTFRSHFGKSPFQSNNIVHTNTCMYTQCIVNGTLHNTIAHTHSVASMAHTCTIILNHSSLYTHQKLTPVKLPTGLLHVAGTALTVDRCLPGQDNHDKLQFGTVLLQLTEDWLHSVHTTHIAQEERVLGDGHPGIAADATQLVDEVPVCVLV